MNASKLRMLPLAGLVLLAGCVGSGLGPIPPARRTPPPQTFDDAGRYAWRMVWDMSQSQFSRSVADLSGQGYRLHAMDVYRDEGATRFAGVFLQDARRGYVRWRHTWRQFERDFRDMKDKGYQPVDLEVVNEGGEVRYSSVWMENPGAGAWRMRWGLRHGEFLDELEHYRGQGYRPTDIEVYRTGDGPRYGYVMVHDPGRTPWVARWGKSADDFNREVGSLSRQGYRLVAVDPVWPQRKAELSGVFLRDGRAGETRMTSSRSSGQVQGEIARLGGRYRPIHVLVIPHREGGKQYVVIWQRN